MSGRIKPDPAEDSLDRVARLMTIEEALIDQIRLDSHLTPDQREQLIREVQERIDQGDLDDDALTSLVRTLGPRGPRGQAGAAAQPEEPLSQD